MLRDKQTAPIVPDTWRRGLETSSPDGASKQKENGQKNLLWSKASKQRQQIKARRDIEDRSVGDKI
jgi:hypothetical protein